MDRYVGVGVMEGTGVRVAVKLGLVLNSLPADLVL